MSLPLSLEPGALLDGRYIVGALINRGGFGAVYRGINTTLPPDEVDRALKVAAPLFANHQGTQSTGSDIVTFLIVGITLAISFDVLGGVLGKLRYKDKLNRRKPV